MRPPLVHIRLLSLAILLAASFIIVEGCANRDSSLDSSLQRMGLSDPSPTAFRVCVRFGCKQTELVGLDLGQWSEVAGLFEPKPEDAEAERLAVSKAVALMETLVGRKALTHDDQPENTGTGRGTRQLDCIAEAMNTSVVLVLLDRAGLLAFHEPGPREKRGFGIFSAHNTATLVETGTNRAWAVDSWFLENGREPYLVPLDQWLEGWEPTR